MLSRLVAAASLILAAAAPIPVAAAAAPILVVAAENFYGDVAQQVGGPDVRVTSILTNPDQDPHLFEASPSVARAVSAARVVVSSGIGYDPWMDKLLAAARNPDRTTIVAAALAGRHDGDNPHIWYDPATMLAVAGAVAEALQRIDPPHASGYATRLQAFQKSMQPLQARIAALRAHLAGTPATATEPVFGYMFAQLGMESRNAGFQLAVMNDTEPSASNVAAFETDLKQHRVKLLVYNSQASSPVAARMAKLARAEHIPVVGATETEPPGKTYQAWMMGTLDAVDRALPP